ncbi:hypothetical protein BKA62DRAFT_833295 [Auriculariales sp. MPI-PUGE-AT-0066]|nr:hypothetical protein BKA62DRAFT_833295 [Auriculariales sp. MPI-PUGE-AT-0066]
MHTRQSQLPALSLALPRSVMPTVRARSSSQSMSVGRSSPTPTTPIARPRMAPPTTLPRNSRDSWSSFSENGDDDAIEIDWTDEQLQLLNTALEMLPTSIVTPFNGPVPPNNYLDKLAREIVAAHEQKNDAWLHSVRQTRLKLHELAKVVSQRHLANIDEEDGKENVRLITKRPLYRQSSMDFLPADQIAANPSVGRASKRLQRADRIVNPSYHPYARPAPAQAHQQHNLFICRTTTPVKRVSSLAQVHPSQPGSSQPIGSSRMVTNPAPRTPISKNMSLPSLGPRMRRTGSFNAPSAFPGSLKRAPSFSGSSAASVSLRNVATVARALRAASLAPSESSQPGSANGSSDEDEKARQRKSKRARTGPETSTEKGTVPRPSASPEQLVSPRTRSVTQAAVADTASAPMVPNAVIATKSLRTTAAATTVRVEVTSPRARVVPAATSSGQAPPVSPTPQKRRKVQPKLDMAANRGRSPSYFGEELPRLPAPIVNPSVLPFHAPADLPMDSIMRTVPQRSDTTAPRRSDIVVPRRFDGDVPRRSEHTVTRPRAIDGDLNTQSTIRVAVRRPRQSAVVPLTDENDENSATSGSSQGGKRTLRRTRPAAQLPTRRISFSTFLSPSGSSQPTGDGLESALQL